MSAGAGAGDPGGRRGTHHAHIGDAGDAGMGSPWASHGVCAAIIAAVSYPEGDSGFGSLDDVAAVVLERNGQFSVVSRSQRLDEDAFAEVVGAPR